MAAHGISIKCFACLFKLFYSNKNVLLIIQKNNTNISAAVSCKWVPKGKFCSQANLEALQKLASETV